MPIWWQLEQGERGTLYARRALGSWVASQGVAEMGVDYPKASDRALLVASFQDGRAARQPYIYLEHGAGQTYAGDPASAHHPSYSGGDDHERCRLFLCPSEQVADRWRARYPSTPAVAVGSPRLDRWHTTAARTADRNIHTVAISFHARNPLVPESNTAWMEYNPHLPAIVDELRGAGLDVLGHGHPRLWPKLEGRWRQLDVEPVEHFADVLDRADVYACDNSSTLPEFASTGKPVCWINSVQYRRHITHGGRFWDWPQGQVQCDSPLELAERICEALLDPPDVRAARARMVKSIYVATDGHAAERAVAAIRMVTADWR